MNTYTALLAILLSGCMSVPTQYLSVDEVLANPGKFDGEQIRVCGWFEADMETCILSTGTGGQLIWVAPSSNICAPENWGKEPYRSWAVVDGIFHTGKSYGHLGTYRHALAGGKPKAIRNMCQSPSSAPNNSFKPTPLRGAA